MRNKKWAAAKTSWDHLKQTDGEKGRRGFEKGSATPLRASSVDKCLSTTSRVFSCQVEIATWKLHNGLFKTNAKIIENFPLKRPYTSIIFKAPWLWVMCCNRRNSKEYLTAGSCVGAKHKVSDLLPWDHMCTFVLLLQNFNWIGCVYAFVQTWTMLQSNLDPRNHDLLLQLRCRLERKNLGERKRVVLNKEHRK